MNQSTSATHGPNQSTDRDHPHRYTAVFANDIELRWQQRWERENIYRTPNPGDSGFDPARPKFFCMDMFPYPSGSGLHVGHPEGYTATDIFSRYKRMCGCNVLHPMAWDAFGLPAEQYALATGVHPAITTRRAIDTFRGQLKRFGFCYDWSREFATIDPDYYKWTQWIWLRAYNAWYDPATDRARPIDELIAKFEADSNAIQMNPDDTLKKAGAWMQPVVIPTPGKQWAHYSLSEQQAFLDSWRLAYLSNQTVNWCPKLGTALANEEVIDGRSERGGFPVSRKPLKQWMFRITAYAERLLRDLDHVDWPESTRTMQREWIGRSEGAEVVFPLRFDSPDNDVVVFTTRPDTIFGATYMVLAPEHPLVEKIITNSANDEVNIAAVRAYVEAARNRADVDRMADTKQKTGVFTGGYAKNPATGEFIPIWIADYVLMNYGTGAIMAVPGQDQRDWDFAKTFNLPIVRTVQPPDDFDGQAYIGEGPAINSANDEVSLDGLNIADAKARIIDWLEDKGHGSRKINYKLRDWLFSRQRYWGEPFPIVYDTAGNHYPISEDHLPVELPDMTDYQPIESDDPQPLLAKATDWMHTTAGAAGVDGELLDPDEPVRRETNTMPGWAGSCWYHLRYCDPRNDERFVSRDAEEYWMNSGDGGVDLYIGGAEHAVLHLLYARFWHKMLYDLGEVSTVEPFRKLFHQGMITSWAYQRADRSLVPITEVDAREDDAGGETFIERATGQPVTQVVAKMSKSLKNVINPDDVIAEYGADTFRLYEMYMGPLDASKPWNPRDISGLFRFLQRVWRLAVNEQTGELMLRDAPDESIEKLLHRTIAKVSDDIERLSFNTAIAAMIEFVNEANKFSGLTHDQLSRFVHMLSPFAPHIADELWSKLGGNEPLFVRNWPTFDEAMLRDDQIELPVQILGKVRGKINVPADASEQQIQQAALNDPRIAELLEGKSVRKVIVVKGRIVNIVAN